jgi:hypothetical protein
VIDGEVPLRHDLFQIPEAEPKPEIPADTQDDDLGFNMSPFEQRWPVPVHKPQAYQAPSIGFATLPTLWSQSAFDHPKAIRNRAVSN